MRTASDMPASPLARLGFRRGFGFSAGWRTRRQLVQHLVRGVLALAQRGQQIGGRGHAVLVGDAAQILVVDLAHRHFELARLALQQLAADLHGARAAGLRSASA